MSRCKHGIDHDLECGKCEDEYEATRNQKSESDAHRARRDTMRTWHKSPPPHVGWWCTDSNKPEEWRWWDGQLWSLPAYSDEPPIMAAMAAKCPTDTLTQAVVYWSHYWPEGARVPRIKP